MGVPWWQIAGWLAGGVLSGAIFFVLAYRAEKKLDEPVDNGPRSVHDDRCEDHGGPDPLAGPPTSL